MEGMRAELSELSLEKEGQDIKGEGEGEGSDGRRLYLGVSHEAGVAGEDSPSIVPGRRGVGVEWRCSMKET